MKERFQNPVLEDDLKLRLFTYNSNNRADVHNIEKVEIYFLDPTEVSDGNPDGRRLVRVIESPDIIQEEIGQYSVTFHLENLLFTIGDYIDVWHVFLESIDQPPSEITNRFKIHPDLWYTDTLPIVYDFSFDVRPNKFRKGSKRFLMIGIHPNVPRASDLSRYYENLAIVSPLKVYIEMESVECMPDEQYLRMVVDGDTIQYREKCVGFYKIDTAELECGIYNIWFEMEFGESIYISDKQQIQVY